jgi:hypothetical protein
MAVLLAGGLAAGVTVALAQDPATPPQYRLAGTASSAAGLTTPPAEGSSGNTEFLIGMPAAFRFDSLAGRALDDIGTPLDRPRATVRYTAFSHPSWDIKVGLSTTLDAASNWQRFSGSPEHLHVGTLPTMHFSSEGRIAERWLLSFNAEGLRTARGQGLDVDLRVDYGLTPHFGLFGSYRMTDSSGDGPETYGFVPSNSARFGVRLRF